MYTFEDLKGIMKTLRAEDGCPWDRAQNHDTLKKHLVEECAEVLEAIDDHDTENLCEELGDVLFQVMFHSEIEAEQGNFTVFFSVFPFPYTRLPGHAQEPHFVNAFRLFSSFPVPVF